MGYIENLEEIKQKLDAEEVINLINPGAPIKHRVKELRTCCVVHGGDGEENLAINKTSHQWKCHSGVCKGTNLVDLYAQVKNLTISESAQELAEYFGIAIQYRKGSFTTTSQKKETKQQPKNKVVFDRKKKADKPKYTKEDIEKCLEGATTQGKDFYFEKKGLLAPPIAKFGKNPCGYDSTIIPLRNIEDELTAILCISNEKKLNFGKPSRSFAILGEIQPEREFFIGEGIATVQTCWEAKKRLIPAVSCGSVNNILPCLKDIYDKYPGTKPIVLLDADESGKTLEVAKEIKKLIPVASFRMPNFTGLQKTDGQKLTDFNDIISKCKGSIEVVQQQLEQEYIIEEDNDSKENPDPQEELYRSLVKLTGDEKFVETLKNRTFENFIEDHKKRFSSGVLLTGYKNLDNILYFLKGDFIVIQGMSNHGKSTFMLQLAHRFLTWGENEKKQPMCVFITYESSPLSVEEKFLNLLGCENEEDPVTLYDTRVESKYSYSDAKDSIQTLSQYNELQRNQDITFLKKMPLQNLNELIKAYKKRFPNRTLILFLDYLQIIESPSKKEGWQLIKENAYALESLAIDNEIIVITGSQVNANREVREGKDIYNAATTVLDVFNHSHPGLELNNESKKNFVEKQGNKSVISISVTKQKHGQSASLEKRFLFNGFHFEENEKHYSSDLSSTAKETTEKTLGNVEDL